MPRAHPLIPQFLLITHSTPTSVRQKEHKPPFLCLLRTPQPRSKIRIVCLFAALFFGTQVLNPYDFSSLIDGPQHKQPPSCIPAAVPHICPMTRAMFLASRRTEFPWISSRADIEGRRLFVLARASFPALLLPRVANFNYLNTGV